MNISEHIWIDKSTSFKWYTSLRISHNKSVKGLYLICTPYRKDVLFEIIPSHELDPKYGECYLIGVAKSREKAIQGVQYFVDRLYNRKDLSYEMLMSSQ